MAAAATGRLSASPHLLSHGVDQARPVWSMELSLSALDSQIEPALGVAESVLFAVDPRAPVSECSLSMPWYTPGKFLFRFKPKPSA